MASFTNIPIPLTGQPEYQSGYLYAKSAGSVGSASGGDNSAAGLQLRWAFSRLLGQKHLPKGNLASVPPYNTNIGFNKAEDFVTVYRAEYKEGNPTKTFPTQLNLTSPQSTLIETGSTREWRYLNIPVANTTTDIIVRFADIAQYNTIRTSINPNTNVNRENFIKAYTGMLEVETPGKLFFAATIGVKLPQPTDFIKIETISVPDKFDTTDKIISSRKTILGSAMTPFPQASSPAKKAARVVCENVQYVRFVYSSGAYPSVIFIETYEDFILGTNNSGTGKWDLVGNFSLSIDDNLVYRRLENLVADNNDPTFLSTYYIDKKWPKYNEVDLMTGAFTVKVQNYKDRWASNPPDSEDLKSAVTKYLDLSKTDEEANASLPSDQAPIDKAQFDLSYLKMLNMVSLDYHVARMLGLGHIDVPRNGDNRIFVHVAQYYTLKLPADYPNPQGLPSTTTLNHMFMTLPTGRNDFRLPPAPVQENVTYGIIDTSSVPPIMLTSPDGLGYSMFDDSRFVNINKAAFDLEVPFGPFFGIENSYCLCEITKPIFFGVEYKKQGETDYRKPELSNDPLFLDYTNRPETVPILEQPNPFFIHQEKEVGFHEYAIYGINWFSRPSSLSNVKSTDETLFPKKNTLIPPMNFAVQLIQKEEPLIFTTSAEQTKLQNLTSPDKTLVRLTFDWNNVHNNSYQYATYAEFFFREKAPVNVRGKIVAVSNPTSLNEVVVTTQSFTITTANVTETIQPNILPADYNKYLNGIFATEDGQSFVISSISSPINGNNPTLTLKQIRQTQSTEVPALSNHFSTIQSYISPSAGLRFMIVENLAEETNWTSLLKKKVGLVRYSTADTIKIANSSYNNGKYKVVAVSLTGTDSDIVVKETIPSTIVDGDMEFEKTVKIIAVNIVNKIFTVKGDVSLEIFIGSSISVLLSEIGDGIYTVNALTLNGTDTEIEVVEVIPTGTTFGNVIFTKTIAVMAVDQANKKITVSGNITAELIPSHKESVTNADGSIIEYNIGGVYEKAMITDVLDLYPPNHPDVIATPSLLGQPIPYSKTGIYKIAFNTYQLPNHPDPEIEWYKGVVKIKEDPNLIYPPVFDPTHTTPQVKTLDVWEIKTSGNTLELTVYDASFDVDYDPVTNINGNFTPSGIWIPIQSGNNVDVNFHPSYKLYVVADNNLNPIIGSNNNFDAATILPLPGQNSKQTFMAAWSIDTTTVDPNPTPHPYQSYINTPVVLLAREIVTPEQPEEPIGPSFATRPDFYGKSTYTIDTKVKTILNTVPITLRKPFALIFLRADEKRVLDVLYKTETVDQILADLKALQSPDADYLNNRWKDLVNGIYENASGLFKEYIPGGFRFPLPDNNTTSVVDTDSIAGDIVIPFFTPYADLNSSFLGETIITWVIRIIDAAFLPLTEQPVIFEFIKKGVQTSGKKPITRNENGDMIPPPNYDQYPMAVKYAKLLDGSLSTTQADVDNLNNEIFVRLTDFTIDGASKNIYFYYAIEMTNNLELGLRSSIMGPVQLVNAYPAETPEIKKTITQLSNSLLGIPTAVKFEINPYIENENIKKVQIYRATNQLDSLSVRTMSLALTVDFDTALTDDFSDLSFPPYGDPLFYRIVALREIVNEQGLGEFVPSKPSNMVLTNIVDNINPPAPQLSYTSDPPIGSPIQLNNVVLSWPKTAHNSKYHLYKMNPTGNWTKIHTIQTNALVVTVPLLSTDLLDGTLFKQDVDLNTIYHRFRVQVENSSGLLNIEQKELTI